MKRSFTSIIYSYLKYMVNMPFFPIPFPFSVVHFLLVGVEKVGGVEGQVESSTNTGTYEMRLQPFFATMGATAGARKPISNSSYSVCASVLRT